MMVQKTVVIGAGGHAKVILELLWAIGGFEVVGLLDPSSEQSSVLKVPVLGGDELLPMLRTQGVAAAVIALGSNHLRDRIADVLRSLEFTLPSAIHPSAIISPSAQIGDGSVVMACAVVGTLAMVGKYAIVNTSAIVEHDNIIGRAAHIAPGAVLGGMVKVGERALVGVGSAVRPGITIGSDAVVGAGSAVVADVPAGMVVAGNPARVLKT